MSKIDHAKRNEVGILQRELRQVNTYSGSGGGDGEHPGEGPFSIAIGDAAESPASRGIAIGQASYADGTYSTAVGPGAYADADAVALGAATTASGVQSVAIGEGATAADYYTVAIGNSAVVELSDGIAIGRVAYTSEDGAIAIGYSSEGSGEESVSIGYLSGATGLRSIAFGRSANAGHDNSVAIGQFAFTSADNQIKLGTSSDTVVVPGTFSNPSARHLKQNIIPAPSLTSIFPELVEYEYIDAAGKRRLGYIADDLIGTDAERFVTFDNDGAPNGIDYLSLLVAQVAQLSAELAALKNETKG